jgi:hypothetical protein
LVKLEFLRLLLTGKHYRQAKVTQHPQGWVTESLS